jgi:hypothetical protein
MIAALAPMARSEDATAKVQQFALKVRLCEGHPYHRDAAPFDEEKAIREAEQKGALRVIAAPTLVITENRKATVMVGGEINNKAKTVEYGTILDTRAHRNKDGTIQLDFVAESSAVGTNLRSDFPKDDVMQFPAERIAGSVAMKPGVVYRVFTSHGESRETWWELRIDGFEEHSKK